MFQRPAKNSAFRGSPRRGFGRQAGWRLPEARGFIRLWQLRNYAEIDDKSPQNLGPLGRDSRLARVEAVLFLAREPITSRKIAKLANLADGNVVRTLIRRLRQLYNEGSSAFQVEEVGGGYQLFTRPELAPWLRRLLQTSVETRLSAPAMETLAVVAYRQPALRVEIEAVRGVHCDEILRQLLERDLIRIVGRAEDLGRPLLYGTTKRFLELFGLRHLDELPRAAEFQSAANKLSGVSDNPTADTTDSQPGDSRNEHKVSTDSTLEENSVTTSIRSAIVPAGLIDEPFETFAWAARKPGAKPLSAAKDEDKEEEDDDWDDDEEDDDEDDDEEDEEDDDFVDEEWEEVDDDEEDDDEEDDDDEDDEEWEDDDDEEEDDGKGANNDKE
jgi:segregation and condensation protein B